MLRNGPNKFGIAAKTLHWGMAVMIAAMFVLGFVMVDMPLGLQKLQWINWHKSLGFLVLVVLVLRAVWRVVSPPPAPLPTHRAWEKTLAHLVHLGLYAAMIAMPITGWLMSSAAGYAVSVFGWFTLPDMIGSDKATQDVLADVHFILAWGLLGLLALHIGGAVKHHVIDKDPTLRRMLPFARAE